MEKLEGFLRFSFPPLIAVLFTLFSNFDNILGLWRTNFYSNEINSAVNVVAGSIGIVIVFGFIVSSLSTVLVNVLGLRSWGAPMFARRSYPAYFFSRNEEWDNGEFEIWQLLGLDENKKISKQVSIRWSLCMANLNTLTALFLGLFFALLSAAYFGNSIPSVWWMYWILFLLMFGFNAWVSFRSMSTINRRLKGQK